MEIYGAKKSQMIELQNKKMDINMKLQLRREKKMQGYTEAVDLVVIVRSTETGARVGSTVDVCVRQR